MTARRSETPAHIRPVPTSATRSVRRGAALLVALLIAGIAVALSPNASAAAEPVSQSAGQFVSGTIGGTDLLMLGPLSGKSAANNGGPAVTQEQMLSSDSMTQQLANLPGGASLPGAGVLNLGAADQFAQAMPNGSAHAGSGAVTSDGGPPPPSDATLDLTGAKNPLAVLGGLKLNAGALSASADQAPGRNGTQTGRYEIAHLTLTLASPALANAIHMVTAGTNAAPGLSTLISRLAGSGLPVPVLESVRSKDPVTALSGVLASFGNINFADGAITGSLTGGNLTIDVAKLLKSALNLDLNNLPPNTHLFQMLAQALPKALGNGLAATQSQLTSAFSKLHLTGLPLTPGPSQVTQALNTLLAPLTNALNSGAGSLSSLFVPMAVELQKQVDPVVNVQERSGGKFTERALQLNVIGDPLAVINLASASVGAGTGPLMGGTPAPTHSGAGSGRRVSTTGADAASTRSLASTGAEPWLTKLGLFGLLGLCLGGALFGATIGVRKSGHGL